MCNDIVEKRPWQLYAVPDHFKTQSMCDDAVRKGFLFLWDVPDWFVTQKQIKILRYDWCNNGLIEWYKGYRKQQA